MLMLVNLIGLEVLIDLGIMNAQIHTASCSRNTRLRINNDTLRLDPACLYRRNQSQQRSGRVTPRIGDKINSCSAFTIHLT
ncbi:hypothetical protein D3C80_1938540 [compost metagenome]